MKKEQTLKDSDNKNELFDLLSNIYDYSKDEYIVILDKDFRYVFANEKAFEKYKLIKTKKDIIGKTMTEIFPKTKYADERNKYLEEAKKNKKTVCYESFIEGIWNDIIIIPILSDKKQIVNYIVLSRDITDKVKLQLESEYRVEFEYLMFEISSKLISVSEDAIDKEIQNVIEMASAFVGLSSARVFIFNEDAKKFESRYSWNFTLNIEQMTENEFFFLQSRVSNFKEVYYADLENVKNKSNTKLKNKTGLNVNSFLKNIKFEEYILIPMTFENRLTGFILSKKEKQDKIVDNRDFILLVLLAQIIASAVERKKNKLSLKKKNRILNALSRINEIIIYEKKDELTLLRKICKAIVETAEYKMAWIGYKFNDKKKSVLPVTSAGFEEGYLDNIKISWDNNEYGQGPTGVAVRTGSVCAARSYQNNDAYKPWRKRAEERGYHSSIALPLLSDNGVIGAVNVYSVEENPFDKEEIDLLSEITANTAYAISKIRDSRLMQKTKSALFEKSARLNGILYSKSKTAFLIIDHNLIVQDCNIEAENILRQKKAYMIGRNITEFHPASEENIQSVLSLIENKVQDEVSFSTFREINGKLWALDCSFSVITDAEKKRLGYLFIARNISEDIEKQKEIENLSQKIIKIQEEITSMMAMEMHDELGQSIAVIKMYLQDFAESIPENSYDQKKYNVLLNLIDQTASQVSKFSRKISPVSREKIGLKAAILEIIEKLKEKGKYKVNHSNLEIFENLFSNGWNIHIYRIVQEAVNNMAKHARADSLKILCESQNNKITLLIEDNGIGFSKQESGGMGLSIMKERAKILGGSISVMSSAGEGTRVVLQVPAKR
ncbi:MAG: GAF domain-containing protein [Spirochaetia bacterium]|nr:GAF domain-containing protein [Spirochaetia bacterium]